MSSFYLRGQRQPAIKWIGGNLKDDDGAPAAAADITKEYSNEQSCSDCKLVYSNKIKKKFCPECGSPLTAEERKALFSAPPKNTTATAEEEENAAVSA